MARSRSRFFIGMVLIGAFCASAVSCGSPGNDGREEEMSWMGGFIGWYLAEYRRLAPEREERARARAARAAQTIRHRAFREWANSREGRRAAGPRINQFYTAPAAIPDAVFSGNIGGTTTAFTISSESAGATLRVRSDVRDAMASARLVRTDGRERYWVQTPGDTFSVGTGDGPFDEEEKLIAALLLSAPESPWPGRTISKMRTDAEEIRRALWEEVQRSGSASR